MVRMVRLGAVSGVAHHRSRHKHLETVKQSLSLPQFHISSNRSLLGFNLIHMLILVQSSMAREGTLGGNIQNGSQGGMDQTRCPSQPQNKPKQLALSSSSCISGNWNSGLSSDTQVLNGIKTIVSDSIFQVCQLLHLTEVIYCLSFKCF